MHLYPELVHDQEFDLCNICKSFIDQEIVPNISIANGYDLGNVNRINLPKLSLLGEFTIQRVRILSCALNFKLPRISSSYNAFTGHCISFPDDNAVVCGLQMPDPQFINRNVQITIEGPRRAMNSPHLEGLLRRSGILQVPANDIIQWLLVFMRSARCVFEFLALGLIFKICIRFLDL